MDNVIFIEHYGESLDFKTVVANEVDTVVGPMTGQSLYNLAKCILIDHDTVVISAMRGCTLSGALKQMSAIRAWGDLLPYVQFKIQENPHVSRF